MGVLQTFGNALISIGQKFTPSSDVDWPRIETLIHGPGASDTLNVIKGGDANSAVFACLMAIGTAFPEPPIVVYRKTEEKAEPLPDHPLSQLLAMPTPKGELSLEEIWFWTAWAKHTDGNAYWLKVRSGNAESGNVIQLWPISPKLIEPKSSNGEWISYYHYQTGPGPNEFVRVPPQNLIHFRLGIDDRDMRKGLSPLKRLVRQISTDEEASRFTDALLRNYAVPGLVVVPKEGTRIDAESADRLTDKLRQKFGSDNRGNIAVLSAMADVLQFGFSPEQLTLSALQRLPEERISAVMGVPAIVAGLGAGLDRATYANFRESREMFTEQKLVPLWRADAARLNVSLKPDFESSPDVYMAFDLSNVRALQEDEDKKYLRLDRGVASRRQWISVNEARSDVGLPAVEGGDELAQSGGDIAGLFGQGPGPGQEEEEASLRHWERKFSDNGRKREDKASAQDVVDALRSIRLIAAGRMQVAVAQYYRKMSEVVVGRARELADVLVPDTRLAIASGPAVATKKLTAEELRRIVQEILDDGGELEHIVRLAYLDVMTDTWHLINIALRASLQFNRNDPGILRVLELAGKNVRGISDTTRDSLIDLLQHASDEGWSIEKIIRGDPTTGVRGMRDLVEETYKGRAETISRTELGTAQNQATTSRYAAAGVKRVRVFDNGLTDDDQPCQEANGAIWTLEEAQQNPLQHPRCTRAFAPLFEDLP